MLNRTYTIDGLGGFRWKKSEHDHISLEWSIWALILPEIQRMKVLVEDAQLLVGP